MTARSFLAAVAIAAGAIARLHAGQESTPPIPVDQEPRHRIVYRDARLRIIDLQVQPGDTSLFHTHAYDNVTIRVVSTDSQTQDLGKDWDARAVRPAGAIGGTDYAGTGLPAHRVRNLNTSLWRQIVVENVRTSGWTSGPPVAALAMNVERNTRSFRAYRVRLAPGARGVAHTHDVPVVTVLVKGQVGLGAGDTHLTRPGDWAIGEAGTTHTLTASGAGDAEVVEVDVR